RALLTKDVPPEKHADLDFLVGLLDWDANVDDEFATHNRVFPPPARPFEETEPLGFREQWVCYGTAWYSAKELTIFPKRDVIITDSAAYGIILTQGYGMFGRLRVSTPAMIRFGEMTEDELFVTADAAQNGVRIENRSATDPLVILKHFGPGNPDAEPLRRLRGAEGAEPGRTRGSMNRASHKWPAIHNAMWPGLVGKGPDSAPPIDLDTMLDLTAGAASNGAKFDGVDLFLFDPHVSIDATDDDLKRLRDKIVARGFVVGSLVAPVWPPTGGGSAMGDDDDRRRFITQVGKACAIGRKLKDLGIRTYGVVRIDSASGPAEWANDPSGNSKKI